jgi:hypothetical protein
MNDEEMLEEKEAGEIDPGLLNTLVKAGENKDGMIALDKKEQEEKRKEANDEPLFKNIVEEAELKVGKVSKKLGKYAENLLFDMKKNPDKYMINTPKGRMSIEQAIKQGYDPATKDFTEKTPDQMMDERLNGISEGGRSKLKQLMDPRRAQVPPQEALSMGIPQESPLVAGNQQEEQPQEAQPQEGQPQEGQPISPEMLQALGGQ